jgi:hypothetical protein
MASLNMNRRISQNIKFIYYVAMVNRSFWRIFLGLSHFSNRRPNEMLESSYSVVIATMTTIIIIIIIGLLSAIQFRIFYPPPPI